MSEDLYQLFAAGVQARRRTVEALRYGLGGALGVAAEPYPHQLATVARILSETEVRHLISDEVGLGKTIQALMVLNALRYQNPHHRAAIIAPDRLIQQWQNECWSRCHVKASVFDSPDEPDDSQVRLVRPQSVQSGVFQPEPGTFDLLIIDEPQTFSAEAFEAVVRLGVEVRQLLVLSATPDMTEPARRRAYMTLLEPQRSGAALLRGRDPDEALDDLETAALERGDIAGSTAYAAWSRSRRIIRASRRDWGRYLPSRRFQRISFAPNDGETEGVRLAMDWARGQSLGLDRWRFGQALFRSPGAAREAIARQQRPRTDPKLNLASQALAGTPGDGRFDALIDVLNGIWRQDPTEQVVVVAGDNPSIDHIERRLRLYLDEEDARKTVATLRRAGEALESEADDIRATHEQLDAFIHGRAKVLIIGAWVQAGLNLHFFARNIVFYSTPWDPEAIDQLIGRLDRLRPQDREAGERGRALPEIGVWSISHDGSIESRMVDALEALDVFERPAPPASIDDTATIRSALTSVFEGEAPRPAIELLHEVRNRWNEGVVSSRLESMNPHTPKAAQAAWDRLQEAPPVQPMLLRKSRRSFAGRSEESLQGFTDLLNRMRLFSFSNRTDRVDPKLAFTTMWYPEQAQSAPLRIAELDVARHWMGGHAPYLYRRSSLKGLPVITVNTDEGETGGRLLRFLDHGDALHDQLIRDVASFSEAKLGDPASPQCRTVQFPEDHPALEWQGRHVLITTGWLDPGDQGLVPFQRSAFSRAIADAPTDAQRIALESDVSAAQEWWRADQRWLRQNAPAMLLADVSVLDEGVWRAVSSEDPWHLLRPFVGEDHKVCARSASARPPPVAAALAARGVREAKARLSAAASSTLRGASLDMRDALSARLIQLLAEAQDLIDMRLAERERREAAPATAQEQLKAGQVAAAERRRAMAARLTRDRQDRLTLVPDRVSEASLRFQSLIIRPAALF